VVGEEEEGLCAVSALDGPDDACSFDSTGRVVGVFEADAISEQGHGERMASGGLGKGLLGMGGRWRTTSWLIDNGNGLSSSASLSRNSRLKLHNTKNDTTIAGASQSHGRNNARHINTTKLVIVHITRPDFKPHV
jgi:hypothetical protein